MDFNTAGGQEHDSRRLPMLFFACSMFKLVALEKKLLFAVFIFGDPFYFSKKKNKGCRFSTIFFFIYKCNTNKKREIL